MFISPMLLEKSDAPFDSDDHIFEPKIDGHRLILSHIDGRTRLYTRHNERIAAAFPSNMMVFDVLRYGKEDVRGYSLMKRKELLNSLTFDNERVGKLPYFEDTGIPLFERIQAMNLEGIVAKRKNSIYVSSRSSAWLKIINWTYAEVTLTGYRKDDFGWLAAVENECGRLQPAGIIELGVTPKQKMAFYSVSKSIVSGEDNHFVYLEPKIKAKIKIRNWTRNGMLRSPAFVEFIV